MPRNTIGIVPEYLRSPDRYSKVSIAWLKYISDGRYIHHAINGGEKH